MSHSRRFAFWVVLAAVARVASAAAPDTEALRLAGEQYASQVRPLLSAYCLECHASAIKEGELDLERFAALEDLRKDPGAWIKVAEMLDNGEMPPADAKQPTNDERQRLRAWVGRFLDAEALAGAGDPGPVVLRRLSNAEYVYTIRDLTGVDLNPVREFPADSAAGEGFTNTGAALVMSPALLEKYFDAAKEIASHAVLLPDGFRFSEHTTRSDWTNDVLARIRQLYARHSDSSGASTVNLQGIVFDTNGGGRLAIEKYLLATVAERDALRQGTKSIEQVAKERGLSSRYLDRLWKTLNSPDSGDSPSLLLDQIRARWEKSTADDVLLLVQEIARWQQALTRFQSVGHMKSWMTDVNPLVERQEIRFKLPGAEAAPDGVATVFLSAQTAGDGGEGDLVLWSKPRIVAPGRPDLMLCDVRDFVSRMSASRQRLFTAAEESLLAAAEASEGQGPVDLAELASRRGIDLASLQAWFAYLGIGVDAASQLALMNGKIDSASGYDFVRGWGSHDTPLVVANSTDNHVRIPGNMKPHGVCVHPAPSVSVAVGWRSPFSLAVQVEGQVTHAHPECGNGVAWTLQLQRGPVRQRLAAGVAQGGAPATFRIAEPLSVRPGDLISLVVSPRDGNHSCDLTDIELNIAGKDDSGRPLAWSLTQDVSPNIDIANPHADRLGNEAVWHFYTEPVQASAGAVAPQGSLLARWQTEGAPAAKRELAAQVEKLLLGEPPADASHPDAVLYRELSSLGGPLLASAWRTSAARPEDLAPGAAGDEALGLDRALFGTRPDGKEIDDQSLCVKAPSVLEIRLPADLAAGAELVVDGSLADTASGRGSVQLFASASPPSSAAPSPQGSLSPQWNVVAPAGTPAREAFDKAFTDFRQLFPAALCYTKIVPVDEVVTLTLFHREDEPLRRLMLSEEETQELERLWSELHFVSHDALTIVDAFAQLMEYATQDSDPKLFEPYRKPIHDAADAFRQSLVDAEPRHVQSLVEFAAHAWRRPLAEGEEEELRALYRRLRGEDLPHEEAFRLTMARVFTAPAFLYRLETAPPGVEPAPVSDWELASRLSYFLWASGPDEQLWSVAARGGLQDPEELQRQARRMLGDARIRRLAKEFACQYLQIYDFDSLDEKSESHFPEFAELRGDMYEEAIRFFTDLFQHDRSVLSILDADHMFVNERLARFYGVETPPGGDWRRVDGAQTHGRGGILGLAATLAKQSGASRTSPILRGNWVYEVLLGDKLPKPPKGVPLLPEDESAIAGMTVRALVEKHSSDPSCAKCHVKIDHFGFALEGYDAIGRRRERDLADRPIDDLVTAPDGAKLAGLAGLRNYLLTTRKQAVVRQFCKKLLGYALAREVQLSDTPLLEQMEKRLAETDYRFSSLVDTIIRSRQFREIRGADVQVVRSE